MAPLVTFALIAANFLAFQIELASGGMVACRAHGLVPARFLASGDWAPVFESLFLHDPSGLTHLGMNMLVLGLFGTVVERSVGHLRFLALYLAAGVLGGLLHVLVDPGSTQPLVGASGAIFGVVAVAGILRPRLLGFVVALGSIQVWHAFAGDGGDASFGAHIGGLVVGAICGAVWRGIDDDDVLEAA